MINSLIYYRDLANIIPEYYIAHYKFNPSGISGDYAINYGNYASLSGNITNKQLVELEDDHALYFNQENPSKVTIQSDASYKNNRVYTFLLNYEQPSYADGVVFSTIFDSGNYKLGFNICVNKYNDIAIEYYKDGTDYTLVETNFNLDTKGIFLVKGTSSQINVGYYNLNLDTTYQESFGVDFSGMFLNSGITIGNGLHSKYKPYNGYLSDFVFVNRNINDTELQILANQFIYDVRQGYVYSLFSEKYSSNLPPFVSGLFGQFDQLSQNCLTDKFIENTGYISGKITGEIAQNINYVSGTIEFKNYEESKEPIQQFFAGIKVTGTLTGYRQVTNLTGYQDLNLSNIYNFCKNQNIDFIIRSGLFQTTQVVNRITNLTGYVEEFVTIPSGTPFLTGYTTELNTSFQLQGRADIKYVYDFVIENNLSFIRKNENIRFFNNILNTGFIVTKTTDFGYTKDYIITPKQNFINKLGVEKVIINYPIVDSDIIEIYNFDKESRGLVVNKDLYISRASKNIYVGPRARNQAIVLNGLLQVPSINYAIVGTSIRFDNINLINTDNLISHHIINTGSVLNFEYIGQDEIIDGQRDFIYLNGQKLISGINYNIINGKTIIDKNNTISNGTIYAFNSLYKFKTVTGNIGSYNLDFQNNRFFKETNILWLNGVQLDRDSFIEASKNDPFYNPVFNTKTTVTIYNDDNQYFNL